MIVTLRKAGEDPVTDLCVFAFVRKVLKGDRARAGAPCRVTRRETATDDATAVAESRRAAPASSGQPVGSPQAGQGGTTLSLPLLQASAGRGDGMTRHSWHMPPARFASNWPEPGMTQITLWSHGQAVFYGLPSVRPHCAKHHTGPGIHPLMKTDLGEKKIRASRVARYTGPAIRAYAQNATSTTGIRISVRTGTKSGIALTCPSLRGMRHGPAGRPPRGT